MVAAAVAHRHRAHRAVLHRHGPHRITDNAALTYLASLVQGVSDEFKYAIVAGAVTGGGLSIIANAPTLLASRSSRGLRGAGGQPPKLLARRLAPPASPCWPSCCLIGGASRGPPQPRAAQGPRSRRRGMASAGPARVVLRGCRHDALRAAGRRLLRQASPRCTGASSATRCSARWCATGRPTARPSGQADRHRQHGGDGRPVRLALRRPALAAAALIALGGDRRGGGGADPGARQPTIVIGRAPVPGTVLYGWRTAGIQSRSRNCPSASKRSGFRARHGYCRHRGYRNRSETGGQRCRHPQHEGLDDVSIQAEVPS